MYICKYIYMYMCRFGTELSSHLKVSVLCTDMRIYKSRYICLCVHTYTYIYIHICVRKSRLHFTADLSHPYFLHPTNTILFSRMPIGLFSCRSRFKVHFHVLVRHVCQQRLSHLILGSKILASC